MTPFADLEPAVCDVFHMADILATLIADEFTEATDGQGYRIDDRSAERMVFMSGLLIDHLQKLREQFYASLDGDRAGGAA